MAHHKNAQGFMNAASPSVISLFLPNAHYPSRKVYLYVVDTTTNFDEHPKLIAQRLERFVDIVGMERVIGGTDYDFNTFAGFGAVDPDIVYAKLKSLSDGAAMASPHA